MHTSGETDRVDANNLNSSCPSRPRHTQSRMSPSVQYGGDEVGAVVLDIGSYAVKAGSVVPFLPPPLTTTSPLTVCCHTRAQLRRRRCAQSSLPFRLRCRPQPRRRRRSLCLRLVPPRQQRAPVPPSRRDPQLCPGRHRRRLGRRLARRRARLCAEAPARLARGVPAPRDRGELEPEREQGTLVRVGV